MKKYEAKNIRNLCLLSHVGVGKTTFLEAQKYDVVIVANNSGINNWNNEEAAKFALDYSQKFSMTEYDWMMPYTLVGLTKVPEEQGMWAGKIAVKIFLPA